MLLNNFLEGAAENRFQKGGHWRFILLFIGFNLLLVAYCLRLPLGDFGNYYYGSKFFVSGIEPLRLYEDLHEFNTLIRQYEIGPFFENYTPVPPFSLLFYVPFLLFTSFWAKLLFNLLSLALFSFSLYRVIRQSGFMNNWFYLLPLVFFQPLFSNYQQGQAYLLIAALLLELFVSWQNRRPLRSGLILAFLFSLKIFPAFMVIFFLLKRDRKAIAWFLLFSLVLAGITCAAVGTSTCLFYYNGVLPRLAMNEITSPFTVSNQSLHGFLMQAFIYDPHQNPWPFAALPSAAVLLETLLYTLIFTILVSVRKEQPAVFFFICLMGLMLINKYTTVYGLLMLLPVVFMLNKAPYARLLWLLPVLALALNLPVQRLAGLPLALQYSRFWLLLLAGFLIVRRLHFSWDWRAALAGLILFLPSALVFYKYARQEEIRIYPSAGVMYDMSAAKNGIRLYSCLGDRDTVETWPVSIQSLDSTGIQIRHSGIVKDKRLLYPNPGRIKKAWLLNRHYLIALSDKNNGAGMYHLLVKDLEQ